jgi:hypothetical protein
LDTPRLEQALCKIVAAYPQILMHKNETYHMRDTIPVPAKMVEAMYKLGPYSEKIHRGYKAPSDIRRPATLEAINRYWPKTKLVVGLRHPLKWFASFYNFNVSSRKKL